jgi:cyclophilin family peptidyl-prolyl cis-trans isomerase
VRRLLIPLTLVAALGLGACGDSSTVKTTSTRGGGGGAGSAKAPPASTTPQTNASGCKQVSAPGPKDVHAAKPTKALAKGRTYTVVLQTSCGEIDIRLDTRQDPKTAANFAALAKSGFYDGLAFHRVVPGFVIQGGDPQGDGSGGPGYSVVEAPPKSQRYTKGVVAMAKTATEAPGTSGSQFFIVTGQDAGLPPEYAVAGRVVKGQDVADKIGSIPPENGQDGPPVDPVVIEKATLKTS